MHTSSSCLPFTHVHIYSLGFYTVKKPIAHILTNTLDMCDVGVDNIIIILLRVSL